ncbi:putative acetyl-CoA transporter [Plasmodium gaboni]|uniref:Acetyl-CoA transporter, putative n=1 Tax=Plasmodium gaboni TaxID=647221 RepID=A0A151LLI6_9APIC|nr:putative acetyl-CoA transporter [Plasmodium gaboni]KYN99737.1 putative acetyl-CoA transporter [Plasmodium gaboni]SOV15193.1 acetyl-CoA transporter, putative [Plasmodium gaboni]
MFNRLFENFEYNFFIKRKKIKYDTKDGQYVKQNTSKKNKDYYNIIFLLSLYTIQGVPIGVSSVVPLIIQDKVSYSQLSILSLVSLPFSIKLLWAPIVDSVYNKRIGRRKSWIIPLQLFCSFTMIYFSNNVSIWLGEKDNIPNLFFLTLFFLLLFFLMATQDIAVDGWALTMLSEENKKAASTCNILGQNIGYCLSQLSFLTLNNKNICFYIFKKYIKFMYLIFNKSTYYRNMYEKMDLLYPSFQPFVDMKKFLKFWGTFILMLTIYTCFKKEKSEHDEEKNKLKNNNEMDNYNISEGQKFDDKMNNEKINNPKKLNNQIRTNEHIKINDIKQTNIQKQSSEINEFANAKDTYKTLYELLFLPPMKIFIILFLINRLPFASVEVGTNFKMLKRGITKEEFALFNPLYIPVSIISPAIIGKIIQKMKPLDVYYFGYVLRYFSNIILSTLLPITKYMYSNKIEGTNIKFYFYYMYIFMAQVFNHFSIDLMTVSSMSFQNIISDPKIGGTYMTFLNTVNNLGSHWSTIFLWLLDYTDKEFCYKGKCVLVDGFYIQMILSFIIGIIINKYILSFTRKLQAFPLEDWRTKYIGKEF